MRPFLIIGFKDSSLKFSDNFNFHFSIFNLLYLHIPYCHRKCSYCAFYSVVKTAGHGEYVEALCKELDVRGDGRRLKTVYYGGGTPTVLDISQLETIIKAIGRNFDVSQLEEVTIEANPEDLSPEYVEKLSELHFFNRLSIGIQSFDDRDLHTINRRHSGRQAVEAVCNAVDAGFENISVDLIMGLPGQTVETWRKNLDCLENELPFEAVKHLSCYELTVEPGTILEKQLDTGRISRVSDYVLDAEYQMLLEWCLKHNFKQYEVSNFCRPGYHSRHNSSYWNRTPYIGVGAGAHSFKGNKRRWNVADIDEYVRGAVAGEIPHGEETLSEVDAVNEYLMTALRTTEGIDKQVLDAMLPADARSQLMSTIANLIEAELLVETVTHYVPTPEGLIRADGMAVDCMVIW